jgi:hypothetical protein
MVGKDIPDKGMHRSKSLPTDCLSSHLFHQPWVWSLFPVVPFQMDLGMSVGVFAPVSMCNCGYIWTHVQVWACMWVCLIQECASMVWACVSICAVYECSYVCAVLVSALGWDGESSVNSMVPVFVLLKGVVSAWLLWMPMWDEFLVFHLRKLLNY